MYDDLKNLLSDINNNLNIDKTCFNEKKYYDEKEFPNILHSGYEYFT